MTASIDPKTKELIIRIPTHEPELSKSGKSYIVAGTSGFMKTIAEINGKTVSISVNAIIGK
jgi:hypothetical protein